VFLECLIFHLIERKWAGIVLGVGVDEGNFFWGDGGGEKMLFLGAPVPETGS
jgi:hypothetical protein